MTIFTCEHKWEAMLCCIYAAFTSKKGHKNVKLMFEPVYQYTLFDEYVHVDADDEIAKKMKVGIINSLSYHFYLQIVRILI